jgi:hypothetical protein
VALGAYQSLRIWVGVPDLHSQHRGAFLGTVITGKGLRLCHLLLSCAGRLVAFFQQAGRALGPEGELLPALEGGLELGLKNVASNLGAPYPTSKLASPYSLLAGRGSEPLEGSRLWLPLARFQRQTKASLEGRDGYPAFCRSPMAHSCWL